MNAGESTAPTLSPDAWLGHIRREYLETFVRDGGSAVKFPIPLDERSRDPLFKGLEGAAREAGCLYLHVDAAETRVHMIDRWFFRVAEQAPWGRLVREVLARFARDEGYALPTDSTESPVEQIASIHGVTPEFIGTRLDPRIEQYVFRERALVREFRIAMTQLCLAELRGEDTSSGTFQILTEWLTGRNTAVSAVKPFKIYTRINRANARHLFESLSWWVRFAGYAGTVITVDAARISVPRNPRDEGVYYTKAMVLDFYEVLRQFIDGADRLSGCLLVVVPDMAFLDEEVSGRGYGAYQALKLRIIDEVRDRRLVNPMAALVRLKSIESSSPGGLQDSLPRSET